MMPYIAVIKDSFREALASRVLWILLVLITFLLIGLAPFGWQWQLNSTLQLGDVRLPGFAKDGRGAAADSPARHVWRKLSADLRRDLGSSDSNDPRKDFQLRRKLNAELNELLQQDDFYAADVWKDAPLDDETKQLTKRLGKLKENEWKRLNLLVLDAAFPGRIRSRPGRSIQFQYLTWEMGSPLPITEDVLDEGVQTAFAAFMDFLLGVVGIFVGILVTASVIPNTFDPGSINLLLSKPISRPLLFLAKFFGGCSFVLINAAYLLFGLWLLAGLRLGIWQHALLMCIPIFLFVFVIYYCVSALSGLIWRNAIVCIVCTIMFWVMCFAVGNAKGVIELFWIEPTRIVDVVDAGNDVIGVTNAKQTVRWDESSKKWTELVGVSPAGPMWFQSALTAGPVYDSKNDRLVIVEQGTKLMVAEKKSQWAKQELGNCPVGMNTLLLEPDGGVLAIARTGIYRLRDEQPTKPPELKMFGVDVPLQHVFGEAAGPFENVGPEEFKMDNSGVATMAMDSGELFIWNKEQVDRYSRTDEGKYELTGETTVEPDDQDMLLAVAGKTILAAKADGTVEARDRDSLAIQAEFRPFGKNQPRSVAASPGGRWFGVVFHHRRAFLFDAETKKQVTSGPMRKTDISAVSFTDAGQVAIADRADRVQTYALPDWERADAKTPKMSTLQKIYRWVVLPIYTVFPKPGQLNETRQYLLTKRETAVAESPDQSLSQTQIALDPWTPVWSSLAFVVAVLMVSCVYVSRKEF